MLLKRVSTLNPMALDSSKGSPITEKPGRPAPILKTFRPARLRLNRLFLGS